MKITGFIAAMVTILSLASCHDNDHKPSEKKEPGIKEEDVTYSADGVNMIGFAAYDSNKSDKRPVVLVVPEWWGLNDYAKMRAKELAKLGYLAFAVDVYGNRAQGNTPDSAGKLATPFYTDHAMIKRRFDAALEKAKSLAQADTSKVAAIGYCFGGAIVNGVARMGEDLDAVVSFHGNLNVVPLKKELLKAQVLICHGAADPLVPQAEVDLFKKQMDSIGAKYTFKAYEGAMHAFTNPNATAMGQKFNLPIKYDAAADTASWNEMKTFFAQIFK
ncbi:MAG TPA: dienelactone hydrolase family protein [Chitinophagaceae bacterium]